MTGTSTRRRAAFNRMMDDASRRRFDLILTKEISRFARNTLDSIYYTRALRALGIGVLFMNDGISTFEPDAELRLTILASIAQEESRKTSERVKWGQKRSMESGVVFGRALLGYDVRDGRLRVNAEGAGTVREIFRLFTEEGKGTRAIARQLAEEGARTAQGSCSWTHTAVLRVLKNEKYCGDLIQKKTYTPDYLSHAKKTNRGQEEQVVLRDHHRSIVSRALFERAQAELRRRAAPRRRYTARYALSGKIVCGVCGSSYVSRVKKENGGSRQFWCCAGRLRSAASCAAPNLRDDRLRPRLTEAVKSLRLWARVPEKPLLDALARSCGAETMSGAAETARRLLRGDAWDDALIRNLIERVTVDGDGSLRVSFAAAGGEVRCPAGAPGDQSGTQAPISVSSPLSSGYGME